MTEWVAVQLEEGDEHIEIPTESDGTMLLTSVTAQFPGVTGLKFRNPETGGLRGIRCHDNILYPPTEEGWSNISYICTRPTGALAPSKVIIFNISILILFNHIPTSFLLHTLPIKLRRLGGHESDWEVRLES